MPKPILNDDEDSESLFDEDSNDQVEAQSNDENMRVEEPGETEDEDEASGSGSSATSSRRRGTRRRYMNRRSESGDSNRNTSKSSRSRTSRRSIAKNEEDDSSEAENSASNKGGSDASEEQEVDAKRRKKIKEEEPEMPEEQGKLLPLILTGDKRRGVFECDYCRKDISQVPRIRCAICPEFDMCLECFSSTQGKGMLSGSGSLGNHKALHGYRVADSTRYCLFPTTKLVANHLENISGGENAPAAESSTEASPSEHETKDRSIAESLTAVFSERSGFGSKNMWTVEEDLRLLDGIKTHGLGNWGEIAEAVSGNKSVKRCMERYFDDYLGRYGYILPPFLLVQTDEDKVSKQTKIDSAAVFQAKPFSGTFVPTTSLPVDGLPPPYLPPIDVRAGEKVNRDLNSRTEQLAMKAMESATSADEAAKICQEYHAKGNGLVIPPRVEDIEDLPGSDLAGYMPRRGDFDVEWDNDAENVLAEMEFSSDDTPSDRALKLKMLEIYNAKLNERMRRKQFVEERGLLNYRKQQLEDMMRPPDERDLINRLRLVARFHCKEEHEELVENILKAKRLRKEIAKLQRYRQMGIRTLADAEKFELDKFRRKAHEAAYVKGADNNMPLPITNSMHDLDDGPKDDNAFEESEIQKMPGAQLLSSKEIALLARIKLTPQEYLMVKRTLLQEALRKGLLSSESEAKKVVYKLNVEKSDEIINFFLRAGWISVKSSS